MAEHTSFGKMLLCSLAQSRVLEVRMLRAAALCSVLAAACAPHSSSSLRLPRRNAINMVELQ